MVKEVPMTFQVEPDLRDEFSEATALADRLASQVLREFMRAYVNQSRERKQNPENNAVPHVQYENTLRKILLKRRVE